MQLSELWRTAARDHRAHLLFCKISIATLIYTLNQTTHQSQSRALLPQILKPLNTGQLYVRLTHSSKFSLQNSPQHEFSFNLEKHGAHQ